MIRKNKVKITPLAPNARLNLINPWDYKTFETFWKAALKEDDIHIIGITGNYGIGKTSMIESYERKNLLPRRKYLHVSMSRFGDQAAEEKEKEEQKLEFELLRQITARFGEKELPFSTANLIADHKKLKWTRRLLALWVSLVVFCLLLLLYQSPQIAAINAIGKVHESMMPYYAKMHAFFRPTFSLLVKAWTGIDSGLALGLRKVKNPTLFSIICFLAVYSAMMVFSPKMFRWLKVFLGVISFFFLFLLVYIYWKSILVAPYILLILAFFLSLIAYMLPALIRPIFRMLVETGIARHAAIACWGCVTAFFVALLLITIPDALRDLWNNPWTPEGIAAFLRGIAYWLLCILSSIGGCYVVRTFFARIKIKSIVMSFERFAVEIRDSGVGVLDKYGYELIYDLEAVAQKIEYVVVFDDMDRIKSNKCVSLCRKLRDINIIMNERRRGRQPIRFVFLINDEIVGKIGEYTKFFDYILPVYPSISSETLEERWEREFLPDIIFCNNRASGQSWVGWSASGIKVQNYPKFFYIINTCKRIHSDCLMDYRTAHMIRNEYLILTYQEEQRNSGSELDEALSVDDRLTFATYKALFPEDYSKFRKNQSVFQAKEKYTALDRIQSGCNSLRTLSKKGQLLYMIWRKDAFSPDNDAVWPKRSIERLFQKCTGDFMNWRREVAPDEYAYADV